MSSNKFWDIPEYEEKLVPFYQFGTIPCRILLEKAINKYEIEEKEGQFGISCYIQIKIWDKFENEFQFYQFKVDSKRLRRVLNNCSVATKKYPSIWDITRIGEGFQTQFEFKEAILSYQTALETSVEKTVEKKSKKSE